MKPNARIYVAGHAGMVGSALVRALQGRPHSAIISRSRSELDLCDQAATREFMADERPDVVILAAARVGGIHANNTYPAEFIYENLAAAQNVIDAAYRAGVEQLLFLGSSCIYPRDAAQPMREDCLLSGPLEPTNEPYAIAKIAGLKLCQYYRKQYGVLFHSAMPTNLYGPGDNYHPQNSHVLPALIRRFHEAKLRQSPEVVVWGSGSPMREFLHVDDLAAGLVHLLGLETPPDWVNIGYGSDVSIRSVAETIKSVVGYEGELTWDRSKLDGTPRKLMDSSRMLATGWEPRIALEDGIRDAYSHFQRECAAGALRT